MLPAAKLNRGSLTATNGVPVDLLTQPIPCLVASMLTPGELACFVRVSTGTYRDILRAVPNGVNHINLTHLNLDGCVITDITILRGNTTIIQLGLYDLGHGTNLEPLASMPELRVLDISRRGGSPVRKRNFDITALGSCFQLMSLDISGRSVCDLSPLVGCQELQELHAVNCRYIGPMDCMLQCPRLSVLTSRWSYMSGLISVDRCVHFAADDWSRFARRALTNHERRLQKLMRRWGHFTKIEGTNAVTDFILAKQQQRGQ